MEQPLPQSGPQSDIRLPLKENEAKPKLPTALLGLLSYAHILFLVPLFTSAPGSFERFHAVQGGVLFLAATAAMLIGAMLPPMLGSVLFSAAVVLELVLAIIGTKAILLGQRDGLPYLGRVASRFLRP